MIERWSKKMKFFFFLLLFINILSRAYFLLCFKNWQLRAAMPAKKKLHSKITLGDLFSELLLSSSDRFERVMRFQRGEKMFFRHFFREYRAG